LNGDHVKGPKWPETWFEIDQNTATLFCDRIVWQEGKTMWDIGCVVASILFFYIAIGYATGCDRLGAKETQR
jgi:hypothetical protein